MSKIKPDRAFAKEIFSSFGGICAKGETSSAGASEMRNFRILPDGSIEKRCGWETVHALPDRVRGVWQGTVNGLRLTCVVGGSTVYRISADGETTSIGSLSSSEGRVHFCLYRKRLYLADGVKLYVLLETRTVFQPAEGYAPLFGINWHPTEFGSVHEQLNLFTNRMRIHYYNSTGTNVFVLPFFPKSVDKVRIDGVTDLAFSLSGDRLTVSRIGSYVEVAMTIDLESLHLSRLQKAARFYADRLNGREFLLVSSKLDPQYLYCSATVDETMLNASRAYYPDSDPLYFKEAQVLTVGTSDTPVSRFCTERDRVLAFWEGGAVSIALSPESDAVESYPFLRGIGCISLENDLYLDGDPVITNISGVFRLDRSASEPDRFRALALGEQMPFCRDVTFLRNMIAFRDSEHSELWFRDATDVYGIVWVYNTVCSEWYCFSGVFADFFLELDGRLGFVMDDRICCFGESLGTDDGAVFEAVYTSGYLCFSSPESVKRSLRVSLCGWGCEATLELQSEKKTQSFALSATASDAPLVLDKRARFGRFKHLRFSLRDTGKHRSRWSRLALYSNL
jgi:hypothetical protein